MKKKKIIIGLIAGISVGVMAAVLFSEKGSGARKKIIDKTSDLANSLKDYFAGIIKGGKNTVAASN